jgi:hypothetical protein
MICFQIIDLFLEEQHPQFFANEFHDFQGPIEARPFFCISAISNNTVLSLYE